MNLKKIQGDQAEQKALQAYLDRGARLLSRNYRVKAGELDLVFEERAIEAPQKQPSGQLSGQLVIVEVRARTSGRAWETPAESLTPTKLASIRRATSCLLVDPQWRDRAPHWASIRFDLAAWDGSRLQIHPNFWWY